MKIGFFDSGIGGLSVLYEAKRAMPRADFLYYADCDRAPYGEKTEMEVSAFDVVQNLFPDKTKDFVININETDIALVKEIRAGIDSKDLEKLARSIVDTLSSEFYTQATVGIGTVVEGIEDLARSFKEAQVALEVGKVFDTEKAIVNYDNLGIARLIYQLPTTLCDMFLREVFKRGSIDSLDQETSTCPKPPANSSSTATRWSIVWRRSNA